MLLRVPARQSVYAVPPIFLATHVHPPSRVRETRVTAVTIIAVAVVAIILLRMWLTVLIIIIGPRTDRVLDHRIEPFVHTSYAHSTSCSAMRGEVLALWLRESSLCRWPKSSG